MFVISTDCIQVWMIKLPMKHSAHEKTKSVTAGSRGGENSNVFEISLERWGSLNIPSGRIVHPELVAGLP